ncbi:MobF family relaxase [Actinacidiphila acididurans]|uniref:Relaxase domain-containing protein n=1 Tax=Actinacidiphila acididurans TaxID=2784346 RepID=A0ABS2TW59_9ACTN|nr:MobF family relaxase [Actinacidiphila acididurans]MBM9506741.1 relaxase domain-containing protein [Actinacidiphila acididurans]
MTTLGPDMAQIEYRLSEQCGCDMDHRHAALEEATGPDAQVDYRLGESRDLEWIGRGLPDVGLTPGGHVDPDAARALMDGRDPRTGEQLVAPKMAVDPRAKLSATELVAAVTAAADARGQSPAELLANDRLAKRFARLERGLRRDGEAHRLPVSDAEAIAIAAGVDITAVYGAADLAEARRFRNRRVRVGNRGFDLTLDLSKSYSTLVALAGEDAAEELRATFLEAARETVAAVEDWAAYAMTGHHGDGQAADRLRTSGALGWMTVHYSARPVDGVPGDPHLHVHVSLAHLVHAEDGKWRTLGAGGRDLHRHAHAADALVKARLRALTAERFGMRWERHPETGAWEVVAIDEDLRRAFSRRAGQITAAAAEGATTVEQKLLAAQLAEAKDVVTEQADVRASWRERAEQIVGDVDAMVAAAMPGPQPGSGAGIGPGGPLVPPPTDIAAYIWRQDGGLTEHRKAVSRADVLAAVIDACPYGLPDAAAAEALTDAVLAVPGHAVALPPQGAVHMSNSRRYTHVSVLAAEQVIEETAAARLAEGAGQVTPAAADLAVSVFEATRSSGDRPFRLSAEQRAVVHRLLTAGHGLDVVVGVAGAGKTTLLSAARTGWEAAGLRVAGASTAAVAAAGLRAGSGIPSYTVAAWLHDLDTGGRRLAVTDVLVLDEAAMVDDRALARLLTAANTAGTKVVGVGDWMQLRAIGIGGGFRRAHELVDGVQLTENRRQTDAVERAALQTWRDGARRTALAALAEHGRIHAVRTADQAYEAMLATWWELRDQAGPDAHDQVEGLVVLAARNEDVDLLNRGARALRQQAGELTGGRAFALAGGERLHLAVGDLVRARKNDYRGRRGTGEVDVLNGYRGVVVGVGPEGARVQWRREVEGGTVVEDAVLTTDQIAAGALSHGYAMTIAAAQGLTADHALVYGVGADAYSLYPAISRARQDTHLWLPADVVEDQATRIRLGEARTETELLHRAVAAYAASLEDDQPDGMVGDQLAAGDGAVHREPPPAVREPGPAAPASAPGIEPVHEYASASTTPAAEPEPKFPDWRNRPYGAVPAVHLDRQLADAVGRAEDARRQAKEIERRAAARETELAATPTPGQARAAAAAAVLETADRLAVTAAEQSARAEQQTAAAARARGVWEEVARSLNKGRLALRLAGTSRRETEQIVAQHQQQEREAVAAAHSADAKARTATRQAWETATPVGDMAGVDTRTAAPRTAADLQAKLRELREQLPTVASRVDAAAADDARYLRQQAGGRLQRAEQHTAAAAGIQAEQQLRAAIGQLAPWLNAAESQARTQAARLAAPPAQPRPEPQQPRYEPPSAGRSVPGPGR